MTVVYPWSRNTKVNTKVFTPASKDDLIKAIKKNKNFLTFGNGKSYGDVCLNNKKLISMKNFNRILYFDKKNGEIEVQAGILVSDLLPEVIKENYFLPVTAGTKFITIGGMVANNVHGKNIKKNYFSDYITSLEIIKTNGKSIRCNKSNNYHLFKNTIGGIGLTGVIFSVRFKLKKINSIYLEKKNIFFNNLNKINEFDNISKGYDYSVSWLDSFSRPGNLKGIHFLTKHSKIKIPNFQYEIKKRKISFFHKLLFIMFSNYYLYRFVNFGFYLMHFLNFKKNVSIENFFYVQDKYIDWNKIYGKKGFIEFHILVPKNKAINFLRKFLEFCHQNKIFSNLIVLKRLKSKKHNINFQGDGLSISCDFIINNKFDKLVNFYIKNAKVFGYIFYFAKDSVVSKHNCKFDKKFYKFKKLIKIYNEKNKISSKLSDRVGLTK